MNLSEKQKLFPNLVVKLIDHIYANGYEMTFGECWRSPQTAAVYAMQGKGIKTSLHIDRIAIDINLFKDHKYLTLSEDYEWLGKFWESLSTPDYECCWGGNFKHLPDGNHFSIADGGRE